VKIYEKAMMQWNEDALTFTSDYSLQAF